MPTELDLEVLALAVTSGRVTLHELEEAYRSRTGRYICYGTIYNVVRRMQLYGWVQIVDYPHDSRARSCELTPKGVATLRRAVDHFHYLAAVAEDAVERIDQAWQSGSSITALDSRPHARAHQAR